MKKLLLLMLVGCGGGGSGSGLDSNKKLSDLTVAELNEECNYAYDTYPAVTITCPGGTTAKKGQTGTRATDCAATTNDIPATCTATVGQAEACFADLYAEPDSAYCSTSPTIPASCAPLMSAGCQGTARTEPMTRAELVELAGRFVR